MRTVIAGAAMGRRTAAGGGGMTEDFSTFPTDITKSADVIQNNTYGRSAPSMETDGDASYWIGNSARWFANGNFTYEFDYLVNPWDSGRDIYNSSFWMSADRQNGFAWRMDQSGSLFLRITGGSHGIISTNQGAPADNTWYHVKLTAVGNSVTALVTRISDSATVMNYTFDLTSYIDGSHPTYGYFGQHADAAGSAAGTYIDNIEINGGGGLVAGAAGIWDASAIIGLADTDPIVQWNDSSGNAAHLTQSDSNRRPLYRTNQINGYPVARFDGTSDRMYATGPDAAAAAQTRFIVFKASALGGTLIGGSSTQYGYGFTTSGGSSSLAMTQEGSGNNYATGVALSTGTVYLATLVWEDSTNYVEIRRNGSSSASTHSMTISSIGGLTLGSHGAAYDGGYFQGDVAFAAHYNTRLSGADISANETYLANRFGITI